MDTPPDTRIQITSTIDIRNSDVLGRLRASYGIIGAAALTIVLEKAAQGDPARKNQILRSWGIR